MPASDGTHEPANPFKSQRSSSRSSRPASNCASDLTLRDTDSKTRSGTLRYLSWILTIPISVVVVLFAISNRQAATLGLWPLPEDMTLEVPVFLVALVPAVLGILAGGLITWLSGGHHRRAARRRGRRIARLEAELGELKARHGAVAENVREHADSARREAASRAIVTAPRQEALPASVQLGKAPAPAAAEAS